MGRPRNFDRDQAVYKAMRLFWLKGFDGTSLEDLLLEIKIKNSSFYQAFKSKQKLFMEAISCYDKTFKNKRVETLSLRDRPAGQILKFYFHQFIYQGPKQKFPSGCFMAQTAATLKKSNGLVARLVLENKKQLEDLLHRLIQWGQARGEFKALHSAIDLAKTLVGLLYGLTILSRIEKTETQMLKTLNLFVEVITT